jgi:hypothetical protein
VWGTVGVLVLAFVAQVHLSVRQKSAILHEPLYAYAGYQYLSRGAYRVNFDSPPLLKQLAALPLLGFALEAEAGPEERAHALAITFLYENRVPVERLLERLRAPFLILGVVLGLVVFVWARALYGSCGGVLALWLYAFSTALLGEAGFANHDFGLTCLSVLTLYAGWRLRARPSMAGALAVGVILGVALVTKFSALLLVPALVGFGLLDALAAPGGQPRRRAVARRAGLLGAMVAAAAVVVWADYGFAVGILRVDLYRQVFERIAPGGVLSRLAGRLPASLPLPASLYVEGGLLQMIHGWVGHINYFLGEVSYTGWWSYYLVTLLYRAPLPLLVLGVLRLATWRPGASVPVRDEIWLLAYGGLTFVLFSLSRTQLGLRYVLVVFPLAFVFLGGLAAGGWAQMRPALRAAVAACLAWYAVDSLRAFPDYLAYFNPLAGGPDAGYRKVVEGVDLGQDAAGLQRFVAAGAIDEMRVSCFGCPPPRYLGPAFKPLGCRPVTGWVAVSVRHLVMPEPFLPRGCFDWLSGREPVARIGHTIHVFELPAGAP